MCELEKIIGKRALEELLCLAGGCLGGRLGGQSHMLLPVQR